MAGISSNSSFRDFVESGDRGLGEARVVDVQRQADQLARARSAPASLRSPSNSAASAAGSKKAPPSMSSADTPFSGMRKRTGPSQAIELPGDPAADRGAFGRRGAHQRHVGIVLVEQPAAIFFRHGRRRPEIHHVERADRADIGQPVRAIAPKRSSVAGSTPPNSRSQTSVVVMSMTPASRPLSASFSMVRPPVPVAWNTRQS